MSCGRCPSLSRASTRSIALSTCSLILVGRSSRSFRAERVTTSLYTLVGFGLPGCPRCVHLCLHLLPGKGRVAFSLCHRGEILLLLVSFQPLSKRFDHDLA